jgi:hypothetical protein
MKTITLFLFGLLVGSTLAGVTLHLITQPTVQYVSADYCWRVDAFRQDINQPIKRGHDDYKQVYEAFCK